MHLHVHVQYCVGIIVKSAKHNPLVFKILFTTRGPRKELVNTTSRTYYSLDFLRYDHQAEHNKLSSVLNGKRYWADAIWKERKVTFDKVEYLLSWSGYAAKTWEPVYRVPPSLIVDYEKRGKRPPSAPSARREQQSARSLVAPPVVCIRFYVSADI